MLGKACIRVVSYRTSGVLSSTEHTTRHVFAKLK